jgi:glucokinase
MLELAGGKIGGITGEIVAKALIANDQLAHQTTRECAGMLALWLSNMVDVLDPEIIVIGGGAAALYQSSFETIREQVRQFSINPRAHEIPVVTAHYGADAGIAGGAALCA